MAVGALVMRSRIWLSARVRSLTALSRGIFTARSASTIPVLILGRAMARPVARRAVETPL